MAAIVVLAGHWWNVEAADYSENIYKALPLRVSLTGNQLDLKVAPRPVSTTRRVASKDADKYLLDHGKVMHLYAIRMPAMDAAFHLHPTLLDGDDFRDALPAMPPGALPTVRRCGACERFSGDAAGDGGCSGWNAGHGAQRRGRGGASGGGIGRNAGVVLQAAGWLHDGLG